MDLIALNLAWKALPLALALSGADANGKKLKGWELP